MHSQVAEVQQHLVSGQLLLNDIVPVNHHDGHADEEVEVVRLQGENRGWITAGGGRDLAESSPPFTSVSLAGIFCSWQFCLVVLRK